MAAKGPIVYVYLLDQARPDLVTAELVAAHVEHIRELDDAGQLVLCGPFVDFKGGMVVLKASSAEEARAVADRDPFVASGYETFDLRTWELGNRENGYLA